MMLDKKLLQEFEKILSKERVKYEPEDLLSYSYDAYLPEYKPQAVLFPLTTEEAMGVMRIASKYGVAVTPRGSGTNLFSGSLAKQGGIILCFSLMNRICEIDPANRYAIVEPGVILADLQREVESRNLFYPPDPGSSSIATIGGTVNTNAGGMRGVKYGVTRDYILGLELVLANGECINIGSRVTKDVVGYDMVRLICGSEGTLALTTHITLRLLPKPQTRRTILAAYPKLEDASQTVAEIMAAGIIPATLELMDKVIIRAIEDFLKLGLPLKGEALLLIEVDGDQDSVSRDLQVISQFCTSLGAEEIRLANSEKENEQLWLARRSAFGAMARVRPNCIIEDATVPVSFLPIAIKKIQDIADKYDLLIGVLAHAGDGNLHPFILIDGRNPEELAKVEKASEEIFQYAVSVGGTLSGEHGIGTAKYRHLGIKLDPSTLEIMRKIKQGFDPKGILNPGSFLELSQS
jgi:glycolate oxidase